MSKDIYVIAEQRDGNVAKVTNELLGEATILAGDLGEEVYAVIMGEKVADKADELIAAGADHVIVVEDPMLKEYVTEPYTKVVTTIIKEKDPNIVLYGATSIGRDLAPRVAARVHTGLTADCTHLDIDMQKYFDFLHATSTADTVAIEKRFGMEDKALKMTRPAFGGNVMATIRCDSYRPQMATVRPGVMKKLENGEGRKGDVENFKVDFTAEDMNVVLKEVVIEDKKTEDITEAKVLVSGGRGCGNKEFFYDVLQPIADEINGAMISSSRAGVDGFGMPKDRQVGQTGKTVRPDLYMANGISGAIQHMAGMENSEYVIAINKNDTAAIFEVADLGIVGDVKVILPKLHDALVKYNKEN